MKFIVVIYGHIGGIVAQELQRGISDAIRRKGYNELRHLIDPDKDLHSETARDIFFDRVSAERGIAGVLACYVRISDVLISRLYDRKLPIVLVENHTEFGRCVTINQVKASYKAVSQFINMGRTRIGCIMPPEDSDPLWRNRIAGYRLALKDHDLPYDPSLISYLDWVDVRPGGLATRALLERAGKVDAILYGSDSAAAGGLKMLRDLGRIVPDDVAVIGFDDEPFGIALQPALSTVRQPIRKMAETGLGLLFESMEKGDLSHREIEMETELVLRGSCVKGVEEAAWR